MGAVEILVILVVVVGIPAFALNWVAKQRGQSSKFALWGLLSYAGLIIGLLMMLAVPTKQPDA